MSSPMYQFLDTVGDATGSFEANVDGSVTPVVFKLKPQNARQAILIHRMIVHIQDAATAFNASNYGGVSTLTNGLTGGIYRESDDSVLSEISGGFTVKSNADWGALCFDAVPLDFGSGSEFFQVRWTFTKAGAPLRIIPGTYFGINVNDDLTGLTRHTFMMQGRRTYYRAP